jgi:hypothetical protein
MSGKRYGTLRTEPIEPVDFELLAHGEDEDGNPVPIWHQFTARPQTDAGDLAAFAFAGDDGSRLMSVLIKLIRKMVVNNDGISEKWTGEPLERPENAGADWVEKFRAPDGTLMTMDRLAEFSDPSLGSSRRRMLHLLMESDEVVEMEDLSEIVKDLMSIAAARPITAPSRS